ncbi:MAG: hypothetical protein JRJ77_15345 [Deltaproteobacteria bacterium]|nr:hypothetical protein [Deltaproteobacteria bacterium]
MVKNISEEDVRQAIGQVMHPEISRTLVDLDYLVSSLNQAVMKLGAKLEVRIAEMNQQERLAFLDMEQEGWRGLG